jgi:glycosyltransferase involved in cell wall biosynthesis
LGFRRDVPRLLAASDLFVFPSAQEGLPFAVQEALAMEVPVVASAVRGNTDVLDPFCGRLYPLGDVCALAEAILDLLALPPDERRAMGAAGRAKMVRERDVAVCVAQWQSVYGTLLARKGRNLPGGNEGVNARRGG